MLNDKKFENKSIRLKGYDYNLPGAYFVTICLKDRKCLFGRIVKEEMILSDFGRIAKDCWISIPTHFENAEVGSFVVMPNHIHGIIILLETKPVGQTQAFDSLRHALDLQDKSQTDLMYSRLSTVIGSYKSAVTKDINLKGKQNDFKWQTSFHDHIIRNEKELHNIADYIIQNPAMWNEDFENQAFRAILTDAEREKLLKNVYRKLSYN